MQSTLLLATCFQLLSLCQAAPSPSLHFPDLSQVSILLEKRANNNVTDSGPNSGFFHIVVPQLIYWVAILAGCLLILIVIVSRYNWIKRRYRPTFRAVMLPTNLEIKALHIHKATPLPPQAQREVFRGHFGRASHRFRRAAVGPSVGPGGQRIGDRDIDDLNGAEGDELPEYKSGNPGLPDYEAAWQNDQPVTAATTQEASDHTRGITDGTPVLTDAEYERQIREPEQAHVRAGS